MFVGGYRDYLASPVRMQQSSLANVKYALKKVYLSKTARYTFFILLVYNLCRKVPKNMDLVESSLMSFLPILQK